MKMHLLQLMFEVDNRIVTVITTLQAAEDHMLVNEAVKKVKESCPDLTTAKVADYRYLGVEEEVRFIK